MSVDPTVIYAPKAGTYCLVDNEQNEVQPYKFIKEFLSSLGEEIFTVKMLIKYHRQLKGLSQKELAKLSGLADGQICRYETADSSPRIKSLRALGVVLGDGFKDGLILLKKAKREDLY